MSSRWPAGIIRKTPVTPEGPYQDNLAPGVWTLSEATFWQKQGNWPTAGRPKPVGVFGGGSTGTNTNVIDYITIVTLGNATDFGDLSLARSYSAGCSSATRGLFGGGYSGGSYTSTNVNNIDYVSLPTAGNATSFGSLTTARTMVTACSSSTRGVFAGGGFDNASTSGTCVIDYVTIASTGNAVSFGLLQENLSSPAGCSSPTRGIFAGGARSIGSGFYTNAIRSFTIATTGNTVAFGTLPSSNWALFSCSNSTRGLFAGGQTNSTTVVNVISYITIATDGNAIDFGDLSQVTRSGSACASNVRAVFAGGMTYNATVTYNTIEYVTIATTGNVTDFGDLTSARRGLAACSNEHGGLG